MTWVEHRPELKNAVVSLPDGRNAIPVVYAHDMVPCGCCAEPFCLKHDMHYWECDCLGPAEAQDYGMEIVVVDDVEYALTD